MTKIIALLLAFTAGFATAVIYFSNKTNKASDPYDLDEDDLADLDDYDLGDYDFVFDACQTEE